MQTNSMQTATHETDNVQSNVSDAHLLQGVIESLLDGILIVTEDGVPGYQL